MFREGRIFFNKEGLLLWKSIFINYPKKAGLATLYSILNKVFDLAPPLLIGLAVDIVVKKENSYLANWGIEDTWDQLVFISVATVIIWVFESFFEYLFEVEWKSLAQQYQHDMRMKALNHVQCLDLAQTEDKTTGELLSVLNDDVNQLERFLNLGTTAIIQLFVTITCVGAVFFYLAPQVAMYSVLPIPLIVFGSIWFQNFLTDKYRNVRDKVGILNSELSNTLQGTQTVKAFSKEEFETKKISDYSLDYLKANDRAIQISAMFTPLIRMLILIGFLINLLYGGHLTLQGQLAVGTYSVLIFMIQRLLWPLTRLGEILDLYQRSNASFKRITDLCHTPYQIKGGQKTVEVLGDKDLSFNQVSFSYKNGFPIFEDLSLTLPGKKTIGLVGGTGSGKSTLVKLLLRFYDPTKGEIRVEDESLKNFSLSAYRSQFGYVGQDVYLFHGTVKENISYGSESYTDEQIIQAAKLAEAHDFIQNLPEGYQTLVGERGQKLSGGQRQRLSLARALLLNPSVLILDEATSSVDNETEAAIQRSLEKVKAGRTTLIIAHRLSTIVSADLIYVLDKGKLVQKGPHHELIQQSGPYQQLWQVQTGSAQVN